VHYSVGFDLDHRGRTAISQLADTDWVWVPKIVTLRPTRTFAASRPAAQSPFTARAA
jgi:hypothetical protein